MSALEDAKDAVQEAENVMYRRVAESHEAGSHPTQRPVSVRDGCILVDALVKVMEAMEAMEADR